MAPKKTRSDAHPLDQFREDLDQWLFTDNLSYKETLEKLRLDRGFICSSGALSRWRAGRAQGRMLEEIASKAKFSRDVVAKFTESNGQQEAAFKAMLQQVAFELVSSPNPDPMALSQVIGAALKAGDQELKRGALALDRSRYQRETCELLGKGLAHEQAKQIALAPTSNAQKIEQLGQLMFGEGWKEGPQ